MPCCEHYDLIDGNESAFRVDPQSLIFGPGCLDEIGTHAEALGMRRIVLFTDGSLVASDHVTRVRRALERSTINVTVYCDVFVEPTDRSLKSAIEFASNGKFDGYVSVGGGSVIDTCKAANLYASHPAEFSTFVNAPIGDGQQPPGPLKPHIACPTTCGTGSEATGIAIFDFLEMQAKTGIASHHLKPTLGLVDPTVTHTLPPTVIAATAFDVLSHALESLTARPFSARTSPEAPASRPYSQGANPWSDIIAREALKVAGEHLVTAVNDPSALKARERLMWASSLAGVAFGQAGCHLPHGLSYAVSGMVRDFRPKDYTVAGPIVPHGMSVILNAPAVYRKTGPHAPERHIDAYRCLGGSERVVPSEAGDALAELIIQMMKRTDMPNGIAGVGYSTDDLDRLTEGALPQRRLLDMAPMAVDRKVVSELFSDAMTYW